MRIVRQSDDEALRGRPPPRDFVGASEKLEPYLKLRKVRGGTVPERPRYAETRASWAKPPAASDDGRTWDRTRDLPRVKRALSR